MIALQKDALSVSHAGRYDRIMGASTPQPGFATTRWTQIARAVRGNDLDARAALEDLCKA
jgi:hypothetical protein